jgi:ATP-dependent helicase HrpA
LEVRPEFLEHNHRLRQKIEIWQTRLPHRLVADLDGAFAGFYGRRLERVSSVSELNRFLKAGGARSLEAQPLDILGEHASAFAANEFPDLVPVGDQTVPVSYAYAPGQDHDGVTMKLSVPLASVVDPEQLEWAVPGLRSERVSQLLGLLPKNLRRPLMPLTATARAIVEAVPADSRSFLQEMSDFVRRHYGIQIPPSAWAKETLPVHLRPRFEIVGTDFGAPVTGRDLPALLKSLAGSATQPQIGPWQDAAQKWEQYDLSAWDFSDPPESYRVGEVAGLPVLGFPGLQWEEGVVNLRLFRTPIEAEESTRDGWPRLAERVLRRELGWVQKDLRGLSVARVLYVTLGSGDELIATAWENLRRHLFPAKHGGRLVAAEFARFVEEVRTRLPGLARVLIERVMVLLQRRQEALMHRRPLPDMKAQIDALVPPRFLDHIPFECLAHLPRYLQALIVRADRAAVNPAKDADKQARIEPFTRALANGVAMAQGKPEALAAWQQFRWLVEEFKVSCFAQELGTPVPVSAARLTAALEECR